MSEIDNIAEKIEKLPFHEKLKFARQVAKMKSFHTDYAVSSLSWKGYLTAVEEKAVRCEEGEYYVYLWRHAWGEPFYVGSGKDGRWLTKQGRCDRFHAHIDRADAIPYLILRGVDIKTAREYERYVSVNLVRAGYDLANSDNNPVCVDEDVWEYECGKSAHLEENELTTKVCCVVENILVHEPRCDYRVTETFLKTYGNDYFSRNFGSQRKCFD